jgi:hypothetical protein
VKKIIIKQKLQLLLLKKSHCNDTTSTPTNLPLQQGTKIAIIAHVTYSPGLSSATTEDG